MRINFCDSIPLDNGTFGYGVTEGGTSAYCVYCTDEDALLLPINVNAINLIMKGERYGTQTNRKTED